MIILLSNKLCVYVCVFSDSHVNLIKGKPFAFLCLSPMEVTSKHPKASNIRGCIAGRNLFKFRPVTPEKLAASLSGHTLTFQAIMPRKRNRRLQVSTINSSFVFHGCRFHSGGVTLVAIGEVSAPLSLIITTLRPSSFASVLVCQQRSLVCTEVSQYKSI